MRQLRRRTNSALAAVAAAAAMLAILPAQQAVAAGPTFCGLTGFAAANSYVWTGAAHDGSWQTAGNWTVGGVAATAPPGGPYDAGGRRKLDVPSRDVDYVCIGQEPGGAAAHVTLGGPLDANGVPTLYAGAAVAALDLGQGADLTVSGNSRLWLNGPATAARASDVRFGSTLHLQAATLGGVGTLDVAGVLEAASDQYYPVTITTRWCDVGDPGCSGPPPTKGHIVVAAGGQFLVDGTAVGTATAGINLEDKRVVDNSGVVRIANEGYIAADDGTVIENRQTGTIDITNNFGVYQGRSRYGAGLTVLDNDGAVSKTAGAATSVVASDYHQLAHGTVAVGTGTLTVDRSSTSAAVVLPAATVSSGGTYGLGSCSPVHAAGTAPNPSGCDTFTVDPGSPQAASATLSTSSAGSLVRVGTQTTGLPAGAIGQAVQFTTPSSHPTRTNPNIFVMLYDSTLVSASKFLTLTMKRAEDGSTTFVTIANCPASGLPPAGGSCVDRRGIAGVSSSFTGNTARIVIRTMQNSRWVGV